MPRFASFGALVLIVLLEGAGCGGRSIGVPLFELDPRPDSARTDVAEASANRAEPVAPVTKARGPEILELPVADDTAIAWVGGREIMKSQVFDQLLELLPAQVRSAIDLLILDAELVPLARQYGVSVPARHVDFVLRRQWSRIQRNYERDRDPGQGFEAWARARHGKSSAELRSELELRNARTLLRAYTLRYHLRRRGSIELVYFQCHDRKLADSCRALAAQGADLTQIVVGKSAHESRRRGGRLPPLPLDHENPVVRSLRRAGVGELSPVVTIDRHGKQSFAFARVVKRADPDLRPFASVVEQLRASLDRRPVEAYEFLLFGLERDTLETRSRSAGR